MAISGSSTFGAARGTNTSGANTHHHDLALLRPQHEKDGIVSPQKTYRMMEWEFHTPPEERFNIDIDGAMHAARDAGAEAVMFYTQDHWGYAYYLSDVAVRHPHLDRDLFGTEVALAHKLGMSACAYYCLQFNNQSVLAHPDWAWVNEKGELERWMQGPRPSWYMTCLDSPYRQYVLRMIDEIFSRYEVDELFIDIFGMQFILYNGNGRSPFCFCKYTEEAWNREHPGDPYREGFKTPEGWEARYHWHQKRSMTDMLDEILGAALKHRPNLVVSLNGGPESFPDDVMQRVSFIYAEPITTHTGISAGSILMRGFGRPDYQAGTFSRQGYLDLYPGSIPRVQTDALIVQNARTFFVGNAPIVSDLDGQGFSKRWFAVAKENWADVRNVDALLHGIQPVLSTAVWYSNSTRALLDAAKLPQAFRHSTVGAVESLTFAGRPVESLPEFRLTAEELEKFEALVLPEVEVLSDAQAEIIRNWVKQGGTLVATHRCGLRNENRTARSNFALADVLGVDYDSEEGKYAYDAEGRLRPGDFSTTYLESAGHPLAKMLAASTVGLSGSFIRLKKTTAEEVMRYRLPFMVEDLPHNKWFNWGPPPPGTETAGTAVSYNRFGKGQAVYLGIPIFWAMQWRAFWIRKWIPDLMRALVPLPIAEILPQPFSEYVHGTLFYDPEREFILVQILNTLELATEGEYRGVEQVQIQLDPKRLKAHSAQVVWPEKRELAVKEGRDRTVAILEKPARYTAMLLQI
jgi:putative glycosyl hydrolase-like family 6 (GHL6) protein/glycosyl hydrolase family 42 (putative beta-galactosidase)